MKLYPKGGYENVMFVIVSHGCWKDCIQAFTRQKHDWMEYCGVSQIVCENGSLKCPVYNQMAYDKGKINPEGELGEKHAALQREFDGESDQDRAEWDELYKVEYETYKKMEL